MSTENPVRMVAAILGVSCHDDKQIAVMIPEGATVHVRSSQKDGDKRLRDVIWDGHGEAITVFAEDLNQRGKPLQSVREHRLSTGFNDAEHLSPVNQHARPRR